MNDFELLKTQVLFLFCAVPLTLLLFAIFFVQLLSWIVWKIRIRRHRHDTDAFFAHWKTTD